MDGGLAAAGPWAPLCSWPAWRGLHESLQELEQLLRLAGEAGASAETLELADSVAALLEEPVAPGPASYRMHFRPHDREPAEENDLAGQLHDWLGQLARYVADAPALLQAPEAGSLLAVDLPRWWQARLGALSGQLRQMLRGRGARRGPATSPVAAPPDRAPTAHVFPHEEGYAILLPEAAQQTDQVWAELLYRLLRDSGADVARLHLLLLAEWGRLEIPCDEVYTALGLNRRIAPTRRERNRRSDATLRRLRAIRITLYRYRVMPERHGFAYERQVLDLWDLSIREYGQATLVEQGNGLVTRGEGWTVRSGPGSLLAALPAPGLPAFARLLLEELEGRTNRLSLAASSLLALGRTTLEHREVLDLARVAEPDWAKLRAAFRLQQRWGWAPDFTLWPKEEGERLTAATPMQRIPEQTVWTEDLP